MADFPRALLPEATVRRDISRLVAVQLLLRMIARLSLRVPLDSGAKL
jgi:hypothetical protein